MVIGEKCCINKITRKAGSCDGFAMRTIVLGRELGSIRQKAEVHSKRTRFRSGFELRRRKVHDALYRKSRPKTFG